jgi:hypothetical protein
MSKQDTEQKEDISFWKSTSLDELIEQQGISPTSNLDEISDLWPVDDDPDLLLKHVLQDRTERREMSSKE